MKAAGPLLLCLVAAGTGAAEEPPPVMSGRLKAEIRTHLPAYAPPPARPKDTPAPLVAPDPDVLVLPTFSVQEKRIPTNDPDAWRSQRAIQQRAMAAYKDSMTPLEWAMNSWFIPLFSAPASVRARAAYEEKKAAAEVAQLNHLGKVLQLADPTGSAILIKSVNEMEQAEEWRKRPAGGRPR